MCQRNRMLRLVGLPLAAALVVLLGGCAVLTRPFDAAQRERLAAEAQRQLFEGQEPIERPLGLAEATARAVKSHVELRNRRSGEAAGAARPDVRQFALLPSLT